MMGHDKGLHMVTWILVMIGGLNWLVYGLFKWDVVHFLGGADGMMGMIPRIVYVLVGLSAVYELAIHGKSCRYCKPDGNMGGTGMQQ